MCKVERRRRKKKKRLKYQNQARPEKRKSMRNTHPSVKSLRSIVRKVSA